MRVAKRYPVHGERLSVAETAERVGFCESAVRHLRLRLAATVGEEGSLEAVYDHYMAVNGGVRSKRKPWEGRMHDVFGEKMTVKAAAARLGISEDALRQWTRRHRDEQGRHAPLSEAYYFYRQVQTGRRLKHKPPFEPRRYPVRGEQLTIMEAAKRLRCAYQTVDSQMRRNGYSLEEAMDHIDDLQRRRAAMKIMRILEGKA